MSRLTSALTLSELLIFFSNSICAYMSASMKIVGLTVVLLAFLISLAQGTSYSCAMPETTEEKIIECDEDGSTCKVRCKGKGFYMKSDKGARSEVEITVKCRPDSTWQEPLPDCVPIKCPEIENLEHGTYACTLGNWYTSVCIFFCDQGYNMKGEYNIQCLADDDYDKFGKWNFPQPTCSLAGDSCTEPDNIEDKIVVCTKDYMVGTVCTVRCKEPGHYFERKGIVTNRPIHKTRCKKDQTWNNEVPECVPVTCRPEITTLINGSYACTLGNTYSSSCMFFCDEGYEMIGEYSIQCMADKNYDKFGRWSAPQPTCTPNTCSPPDVDPTVEVKCTQDHQLGSKCLFSCMDRRYQISGDSEAECKRKGGKLMWDWKVKPGCVRQKY